MAARFCKRYLPETTNAWLWGAQNLSSSLYEAWDLTGAFSRFSPVVLGHIPPSTVDLVSILLGLTKSSIRCTRYHLAYFLFIRHTLCPIITILITSFVRDAEMSSGFHAQGVSAYNKVPSWITLHLIWYVSLYTASTTHRRCQEKRKFRIRHAWSPPWRT